MTFLLRVWPHLLIGAAILAAGVYINRLGYESGYNASESKWRPAFDAANKALGEANERTRQKDIASRELSQKAEVEHAQTLQALQVRAADADRRVSQLMRNHAKRASSCELPAVPGTTPIADEASQFLERSERFGADLVALARRCEEDAAALTSLQDWVREQQALEHPP